MRNLKNIPKKFESFFCDFSGSKVIITEKDINIRTGYKKSMIDIQHGIAMHVEQRQKVYKLTIQWIEAGSRTLKSNKGKLELNNEGPFFCDIFEDMVKLCYQRAIAYQNLHLKSLTLNGINYCFLGKIFYCIYNQKSLFDGLCRKS